MVKQKNQMAVVIGENLKRLRVEKGWKRQKDFAAALAMKESVYNRIETGKVKPSDASIRKITELLGINPEDIYKGVYNKEKLSPGLTTATSHIDLDTYTSLALKVGALQHQNDALEREVDSLKSDSLEVLGQSRLRYFFLRAIKWQMETLDEQGKVEQIPWQQILKLFGLDKDDLEKTWRRQLNDKHKKYFE